MSPVIASAFSADPSVRRTVVIGRERLGILVSLMKRVFERLRRTRQYNASHAAIRAQISAKARKFPRRVGGNWPRAAWEARNALETSVLLLVACFWEAHYLEQGRTERACPPWIAAGAARVRMYLCPSGATTLLEERPIKVLLVESDPEYVDVLRNGLMDASTSHIEVESASELSEALSRLSQGGIGHGAGPSPRSRSSIVATTCPRAS